MDIKTSGILSQLQKTTTQLGDIRKLAKEIKQNHDLAMELWKTADFHLRMLALLIMDKTQLKPEDIDGLFEDMTSHNDKEKIQLSDWLMANQLLKNKKTTNLITNWQNSPSALKRRTFWYHQGRLRWMGKASPTNTEELLVVLEKTMKNEEPETQWAMNFTAAWIGVFEIKFRNRCIQLGVDTGLFKDEKVSRGCTPSYLPEFIKIESEKRGL